MLNDPIDLSDHIRKITTPELPDQIKELLEPGRFARRIEAASIPDALVNIFKILSPISNNTENCFSNLFEPIRSTCKSNGALRYKKQIIVLERELAIIERNYQNDKPLVELAKIVIAKDNKRIKSLQQSCTKYSEKNKKDWEKEAERIRQNNPVNTSASLLARLVRENLAFPDKAHESIRKHLLTKEFKSHEKKRAKSV
ncbi:hypothetical protein SAMN06296273_2735 [Nitrosomonas ureae]|uniref:Uncharacterized protein n=1 Tax=Nitrosomonas ureae TaxID=44577 RepID=A0A285C130_9PROT|nr:hypothetical protein [Nitrosomonas ureae]SNX61281.1 hypothetical protein SAMN06296273_2735 [Nitrosomonas ureae]